MKKIYFYLTFLAKEKKKAKYQTRIGRASSIGIIHRYIITNNIYLYWQSERKIIIMHIM